MQDNQSPEISSPTPVVPVVETPQQPVVSDASATSYETQSVKGNGFLVGLLSVLLFLSVAIAGFFAYQTQNLSKELLLLKSVPSTTNEAIADSTQMPVATTDPTADWKTYRGGVHNYVIKYPSDWNVDASKAELPINDLNSQELVIFKGEYKIIIMWPSAYGPSLCLFDDQSRVGAPEFGGYCEGEFVNIDSRMRRLVKIDENMSVNRWTIYNKEANSNYFVTVPPISYFAPSNYDKKVIETMDMIMASYKSLNTN